MLIRNKDMHSQLVWQAGLYLNEIGFNDVYQLDGGIINYLDSSEKSNKWIGNCFVFDDRIFY